MTTTTDSNAPPRADDLEIAALVAASAAGDERSWDRLVAQFGPMLWAITRGYRLSDADGADVTQATWCKLIAHLDRLEDPSRLGAWLATTARRECLRVLRGARIAMPYGDALPDLPAPEQDLDDVLTQPDRDAALWRGFARLHDGDRVLLSMLIAESAPSYDEISAALSIPVGSIGPTRARALERLRRELRRDGTLGLVRV